MTTIAVPAWLPTEPEPEVQPEAGAVLTDIRAAATSTSDVASWARSNGAPSDFRGNAADSADHAVTQFADATDAVTAALEKGALAIDRFLTAMARRRSEHADLMERRTSLNSDREALLHRIDGSTEEDVPALQAAAESLRGRFDTYHADVDAWRRRILSDEDAAIAALEAVDTLAEGDTAADAPGRADTAALAAHLQQLGTDTDAVNFWWNGLSEAERNALLISDPGLVGNTNGIPSGDRDEANRASVQRDIEHLLGLEASGQDLSASEQRWLENARSIEDAIAHAHGPKYGGLGVEAYVLAYVPQAFGGDGIAAVAYGDPDTADHTAVYVPGIMQDGTLIADNGAQALNLYEETVNSMAAEDPPRLGSVSTIAWIGYDSPNFNPESMWPGDLGESAGDVAHTVTEANAEQGGILLSQFVDGLNSTHESGDQPHLTVIGHSYGSTTSAHAAADGMAADSLVLIGSPGAGGGVDHVSGLGMPEGQVFVGAADHDPVTWLGGQDGLLPGGWDDGLGLGQDPAQSDFGAHVFAVDNGQEFHGPGGLVNTGFLQNHVNYFDDGNPALANMADVVSGNADDIVDTGGRTQEAHDYLYDWVGDEIEHHVVDPVVEAVVETYESVSEGVGDAVERVEEFWDDLWPDRWP